MKEEILLSIAIPTYNRRNYLSECLPEILKHCDEVDENCKQIEIIIIDNASTDGTEEYLKKINHDRLKTYRNKINIGPDANFIECVKKARGVYVWLFGDDELLVRGGISKVFELIKKQNISLLVNNSVLKKSKLFKNYHEALNYFIWPKYCTFPFPVAHTLITFNIFLKKLFNIDKAYEMHHTSYGHMYAIMENLEKARGIYVFGKREVVRVREKQAEFDKPPGNLEYKLLQYSYYISTLFKNPMVKINAWIFFKVINRPPLLYFRIIILGIKRLIKKILKIN